MPACLDRSSVAGVERLNGIRRADDPPYFHVVEAVAKSVRSVDLAGPLVAA